MSDHDQIWTNAQDIAGIKAEQRGFGERLDKNDKLTDTIHKLTASVETLTSAVKEQGQQIKDGLEKQGERIGAIEKLLALAEQNAQEIKDLKGRVNELEKAPAKRWDKLIGAGIAAAVSGGVAAIWALVRGGGTP